MKRRKLIKGKIGSLETRLLVFPMLAAILFMVIAALMGSYDRISEFDASVMKALYADVDAAPLGSRDLANNARDITSLGSPFLLITMAAMGVIWLLGHRDRAGLWFLTAIAAGGTALSFGLKALYGRDRPPFTSTYLLESSPSFPSGHSLLTAALLPALAIIFMRQERIARIHTTYLALGILLAILVGLTRIVLGAHYPTDVLAGWAVGFGWVALCRAGLGIFENRHVEPTVPASGG